MSFSGYSISQNKKYGRIVLLVDMDCFYCQVEEKLDPSLKGKPVAVVQYNEWRGGGIIAVNYVARAQGVTRYMRGDEAKAKCPEIVLAKVPITRDKGDLNKYRDAGQEVAEVLQKFTKLLYRASVDEAYLDITKAVHDRFHDMNKVAYSLNSRDLENTFAVGYKDFEDYLNKVKALLANTNEEDIEEALSISQDAADLPAVRSSDLRLIIAATIANEIRIAVKAETGYECSAGIAHNKLLAKLACGMNKPNKQTILPLSKTPELFRTLPVRKIQGLGGKFGEELCEDLGVHYLGELVQFTEAKLQKKFDEKNGTWLYNICRGIDLEPVVARFHPKSIGCSKQFSGPSNVCDTDLLNRWLYDLADELCNRLERDTCENNRKATQLVVNFVYELDGKRVTNSRSVPLNTNSRDVLAKNCFELIKTNMKPFLRTGSDKMLQNPVKVLGISAGKFEPIANAQSKLKEMFANQVAKKRRTSQESSGVASTSAASMERQITAEKANENSVETQGECVQDREVIKSTNNSSVCTNMRLGNARKNDDGNKLPPTENEELRGDEDDLSDLEELFTAIDQIEKTEQCRGHNKKEDIKINELETAVRNHEKETFSNKITELGKRNLENKANSTAVESSRAFSENDDDFSDLEALVNEIERSPKNQLSKNQVKANFFKTNSSIKRVCPTPDIFENDENDLSDVEAHASELERLPQDHKCYNETDASLIKPVLNMTRDCNETCSSAVETTNSTGGSEMVTKKAKFSAPAQHKSSLSTDINYRATYAEFAIPQLNSTLLFTKCNTCGAQLYADERSVQSHKDYHIAQLLSQQLRAEYRAEHSSQIKFKTPPSKADTSNGKKKPNAAVVNVPPVSVAAAKITKFFRPATATGDVPLTQTLLPQAAGQQLGNASATQEMLTCDKCHTSICQNDMAEHQDYHLAKELQREFNRLEARSVLIEKKSTSNSKRKRSTLNMTVNSTSQRSSVSKPIEHFFSQTNIAD